MHGVSGLPKNTVHHSAVCALQEVQNVLGLPGKVHAMVAAGIPWWQIMYTGLMSTDAVLMIEARLFRIAARFFPLLLYLPGTCPSPLLLSRRVVVGKEDAHADACACVLGMQVVALHDVSSTGERAAV